jgi:rubrerythrin
MSYEQQDREVPFTGRHESATRRDLLSSVASVPVAAAIAYLVAGQESAWAEQSSSNQNEQPKNPLMEKLHAEFAEECQVYWRYSAFAARAKEDGYPNIARLFRTAAEAEKVHAAALLFIMGAVKETAHNLAASAHYEDFLSTQVLPKSVHQADTERDPAASLALTKFLDASRIHSQVFTRGLDAVKSGKDLEDMPMYACPVCGAVILGDTESHCPVCKTPRAMFLTAR